MCVCVCVYKLYRYIIYISNAYITPRERETNIHLLRLKHLHRPKTSAIIWPKGSSAPSYRKMTCCSRFCPNSPMLQREDTSATPRLFAKKTGFKGVKPHANLSSGHYHCSSIFIILTHTHIYIWSYMLIGSSRKWKSHTLQCFSHWKHDLQTVDLPYRRSFQKEACLAQWDDSQKNPLEIERHRKAKCEWSIWGWYLYKKAGRQLFTEYIGRMSLHSSKIM